MVDFLARLFIKDYKNTDNAKVRTKYGTMASIFGIVTNVILVILKLFIGIISASISIIADGINNLMDMASSVLNLIGFKISSKPADKKHPYGHQRVEYIIGLIIALVIAFVGFELLKTSIEKIITPQEVNTSTITFVILGIAILLKIIQGLFYLKTAKRIKSLSLKASAKDSINDVVATSLVLIGAIVTKLTSVNLDGYFGLAVSLFIIVSAVSLIFETMNPLIGEPMDEEMAKKIVEQIKSHHEILGVHDLLCHSYGPNKYFMSLHCEVDSKEDVMKSHDVIDNIEKEIKEKFDIDLTIHMDPIETDNNELTLLKDKIKKIIFEIDPKINFHDFRMVKGTTHTNLIFDIVIPMEYHINDNELIEMIKNKVNEYNDKYLCVIKVDRDYL